MIFNKEVKEVMVDALDDGRIVRVSESYAKREGLPIIRKFAVDSKEKVAAEAAARKLEEVKLAPFESLRKPLRNKNNVIDSLKENFHWELTRRRKMKNITRKQVAEAVGASEYEIKMVENGVLPTDDFILISRLEKYYEVNLRREGSSSMPRMQEQKPKKVIKEASKVEKDEKLDEGDVEELFKADDLLADKIDLEKD